MSRLSFGISSVTAFLFAATLMWQFPAAQFAHAGEKPQADNGQTGIRITQLQSFGAHPVRQRVSQRWTDHLRHNAGDRVFFGKGSAALGTKARTILAAQARWMREKADVGVLIAGYADDPGPHEENLRISQERAYAVRQRLVEEGVESDRLIVEIMGRAEPISPCQSPICKAQNRRVTTKILRRVAKPRSHNQRRPNASNSNDKAVIRGAELAIPGDGTTQFSTAAH